MQPQADFRRNSIVTSFFALTFYFLWHSDSWPTFEYGTSPDESGCKILMRAYGFGLNFQIQCILYGKSQNPDCAVRIAVKKLELYKVEPENTKTKKCWQTSPVGPGLKYTSAVNLKRATQWRSSPVQWISKTYRDVNFYRKKIVQMLQSGIKQIYRDVNFYRKEEVLFSQLIFFCSNLYDACLSSEV